MDCSKTEVFLSELKRMCEGVGECYKCKIYKLLESPRLCIDGNGAFAKNPTACLLIVQEWSDQHPIKTRLNVFLEAFPNAKIRTKGEEVRLEVCAKEVFGVDVLCINNCYKCWNTPIEEGE